MKIVTWNVNGLRSVLSKDKTGAKTNGTETPNVLRTLLDEHAPDIICLQETKCPCDLPDDNFSMPFRKILSSTTKKGYSGVAVFSTTEPLEIHDDFAHNEEGRLLCLEYPKFFLVNAYVPNSKQDLSRLDYRVNTWEASVRDYLHDLQETKPGSQGTNPGNQGKSVIYVGDLNVAPTELDIHTVKGHARSHGYTMEERTAFAELKGQCGLVDAFRTLHPDQKTYTWFSNFAKSRERNKGWRIDHVLVSKKLETKLVSADILGDYFGSDHVPVMVELKL